MTKTHRTLAVAAALLALGGSVVGATSAMAASQQVAVPAGGSSAPLDVPSVHLRHVHAAGTTHTDSTDSTEADMTTQGDHGSEGPDTAVGMGTPAYLGLLTTDQDVDAAQVQLAAFMESRGLRVELAKDEDGRPHAEYDPFVEANLDAVQAYWDGRLARG